MTEAEMKAAHIALWDWLYENPGEEKDDWPEWAWNGGQYSGVFDDCFACEMAKDKNDRVTIGRCTYCPLQIMSCRSGPESAYESWYNAEDAETRKKYAAVIRDAWRD
jgi:hypothetical protein